MADARERAFIATPFAGPGARIIASPFQFATGEDDNLRIESANSLAGVVLAIQGRRLTPAGAIEPFAFVHTPNTDRSVKTQDYKLGQGALLNLTIFAQSGAPKIGQTYVSARFIRGLTGATIVLGTLLGNYCTAAQHLAYPGSPIESSIAGGGYFRTVQGTVPAAGGSVIETVPTGARWEVISALTIFASDATVATRRPFFVIDAGAADLFVVPSPGTIGASSSLYAQWAQGMTLGATVSALRAFNGIPMGNRLAAGERWKVHAENMQAGDQFTFVNYHVREWLEVSA